MKRIIRFVIPACFASLLSYQVLAEAPVVDDSENFALLEEQQQAAREPSVAHDTENTSYDETQPALAKETPSTSADNENSADLINKVQGLQQDIQELRGQLEVQAHELKQLQEQQLTFYKDLDARLSNNTSKIGKNTSTPTLSLNERVDPLNTASPPPPPAPEPPKPTTNTPQAATDPQVHAIRTTSVNTNPADEQISYLAAYELVKNKRYEDAIVAMQSFVTKYPQGGYTANAQYWLGELYLVKKNYPDAISHFDVVLQQFPSSTKYSASLLKKGYALADSGQIGEAKERLHEVMNKYPDTNTAELAHLKLETLGG
ncbi:MAG: tol-pal system protein YbgF [Legionellaceae bacterium]|nr:tol-pal system protein YbgF [Legionellaceae bacterium]